MGLLAWKMTSGFTMPPFSEILKVFVNECYLASFVAFLITAFHSGGLRGGVSFFLFPTLCSFMSAMLVQDRGGFKMCIIRAKRPLALPWSVAPRTAFPGNVQVLFVSWVMMYLLVPSFSIGMEVFSELHLSAASFSSSPLSIPSFNVQLSYEEITLFWGGVWITSQ